MTDHEARAATTPAATQATESAPKAGEARVDWLRRVLVEHERAMLARDATLVAAKFAKMTKTPFAFFRGTAWLTPGEASPFKTAASSQVALVGDPHPENVGTVVDARGTRHLEFNDFDLADFGSYVDDLRRLATGFWIVTEMGKLKSKKQAEVVGDLVDGYVAEVQGLARGERPFSLTETLLGDALPTFLNDPDEPMTEGQPASQADQALVRDILNGYPSSLPARAKTDTTPVKQLLAIKRVVRRHAGVTSFPLLRFQVLVEGPTPSASDDWVLEIKESTGAPAARVIAIQKQFHEVSEADALVGWAAVGGQEFRVRRVDPGQRRISAERLAKRIKKDDLSKKDLKNLASSVGRLLARGHCQALDRNGKPGLRAIADAIGNKGDGKDRLKDETVAFAERAGKTAEQDFDLLLGLLATKGPTLGWQAGKR